MLNNNVEETLVQHKLWIKSKKSQGACADFSGIDLSGIDLSQSDLRGANFSGANLTGANLCSAWFDYANFSGANLSDAKLKCADLRGANLKGANLQGACLYDAIISKVKGLQNVSWIVPGCLVELNLQLFEEFPQGTIAMIIQNNKEEKTFDMLVENQILRDISDWVKFCGLSRVTSLK